MKQLNCFNIENNKKCFSWAANPHFRMISEGSCEDWSNDAENSALITGITYIFIYIQMENSYF